MSHIPQRKDKDCLNCGTTVQGNYCQNCGQENVVPHETFWHMVKHFLYDITHFDSKFFDSMKFLLLRPGFLPQEYIKGRRASYLNPVKKYVFTSAVFFLIFFGFFKGGDVVKINLATELTREQRANYLKRGEQELLKDTASEMWKEALQVLKDTSKVLTGEDMIKYWDDIEFINLSGKKYTNLKEYDSIQKAIPAVERDGWLQRTIQRKNLKLKEKYRSDPGKGFNTLGNTFLHKLPYLLFASLPLFALILKLLYIRRKNFYYADHAIFSIYHYIFSFILLLFVFGLDKLSTVTGLEVFDALTGLLFLSGGVYLYISMKRFYGQRHMKTFFKFLLLNVSGIIMLVVLFAAFILFSVFEI
ncbi:MAG: DUF3667 domain-containing protein [Chitinophagaceae bacterium]|nr:DUF3667 domain-containing protein [Chitinophagaceae bacterium]MBP9098828.1 DUF3667 domain-containing protein [Ferruginibacter sp.]MBL0305577.1 DUF3667 domain-containing protein [Chitinophagaceae bacterium]HQV59865.1 DUF3667 domain-containing protein [Chitinophagaceae bacterium]HQV87168.1 DUF3667 domain-containing protein [Chitinophagaceae bacterium]